MPVFGNFVGVVVWVVVWGVCVAGFCSVVGLFSCGFSVVAVCPLAVPTIKLKDLSAITVSEFSLSINFKVNL